jgi:hypothetical protein
MVNISRSTSQVCGMMSNKADATHQAMNRYDQLARTRESRRYALGYEPTGPVWQNQPELHRLKYTSPLSRVPIVLQMV